MDLAVTSQNISWFLSPGLYGSRLRRRMSAFLERPSCRWHFTKSVIKTIEWPYGKIRCVFSRGDCKFFGADTFQLKLKKSCDMRYFSSIRNFAQHCEFCCAKIDYNVSFSSFFAQQNLHRGLKRNPQFDERISEELFSLCEQKNSHRGLKRNPQFDEEDCWSRTFDKRPSRFWPRQAGRTWCVGGSVLKKTANLIRSQTK